MKTVRFALVVAECGTPEPYTLWLPPEKDPELQRALKAHRVMTVHRANVGSKADYGEVGLAQDPESTLLLFPKSLKAFAERRVVGVKYELLKPVPQEPAARRKPRPAPKPKAPAATTAAPGGRNPPPVFGELKIVERENEPEKASREKRPLAAPRPREKNAKSRRSSPDLLRAGIEQAMKQLQAGKAVAAYQTLEKTLAREDET